MVTCLYEFVQAEQCLSFTQRVHSFFSFSLWKIELSRVVQLYSNECHGVSGFSLKAIKLSFWFTGFIVTDRVKVIGQPVHLRDIYQENKIRITVF